MASHSHEDTEYALNPSCRGSMPEALWPRGVCAKKENDDPKLRGDNMFES